MGTNNLVKLAQAMMVFHDMFMQKLLGNRLDLFFLHLPRHTCGTGLLSSTSPQDALVSAFVLCHGCDCNKLVSV